MIVASRATRVAPPHLRLAAVFVTVCATLLAATGAAAAVPIPKPPNLDARGYLLIDHASGRVLAEQKADERMEPASITKMMTAYAVFKALGEKRLALDEPVTISERAWRAEGSRSFVQVGTQVPVEALIKGMIVQSGNDATIALAERVGGTEEAFAQLMNEYARRLGMTASNFTNSTGLPDPNLYTTARDIATLARAMIREFPQYYRWYSLREFTWNNITQPNRNGLLARDASVDGIKTGHTESAGYCLVTSANRRNMRLVSVVLGSSSMKARENASAALLNYGYTFYETVRVRAAGDPILQPRVYKGSVESVSVAPARDVLVTLGRGSAGNLRTEATVTEPLIAPLAANKAVGELVVRDGDDIVARAPLFPKMAVAEGGLWSRLTDGVALWFR
jgi:serine-type D-Ala-D-Ala carboxypeptidase (penicillin-binding protein 5/6)